MKYLIILIAILAIGCDKESTEPCNCGVVANDGIDNGCYWLELRNNCSDNKKSFCVDQDKWMTAYIGSDFCITNTDRW
tara:strand:+ start:711 stop:944 length:234 start_codon:yes stop_codon:yes gene_type:complete